MANGRIDRAKLRLRVAGVVRQLWTARCGVAAVETAILLPILLLFLFGIEEFGRAVWTQTSLQAAVEAAARCKAIGSSTCNSDAATQSYAASQAFRLSIPANEFTVSAPSCGTQVSVSHTFNVVVQNLIPALSVTLRAQSCHP